LRYPSSVRPQGNYYHKGNTATTGGARSEGGREGKERKGREGKRRENKRRREEKRREETDEREGEDGKASGESHGFTGHRKRWKLWWV
jgi:hypothetical protein